MGDVGGAGPDGVSGDGCGIERGDVCAGADGDRDFEDVAGGVDADDELYVDRFDDDVGAAVVSARVGGLDFGDDEVGADFLDVGAGGVESGAASRLFFVGCESGDIWVGCGV